MMHSSGPMPIGYSFQEEVVLTGGAGMIHGQESTRTGKNAQGIYS
jgi:hypothetical protein